MTSHTLIKDALATVAIAGIFSCLVLVAEAYHLTLEIESETLAQTAAVIDSQTVPPPRLIPQHKSTDAIEILTTTPERKEESEELQAETVIEEEVPVKKIAPAAEVLEPEVKPTVKVVSAPVESSTFATELISIIEEETNSFRRANGLPAFKRETVLAKNAASYSQTMLRGGFMDHTDLDGCDLACRFDRDGYSASTWGENLANIKFDDPLTPREVADYFMAGWKKSAGHRDNLLSSEFTHQGIGVAKSDNAIYVTVQFAKVGQ